MKRTLRKRYDRVVTSYQYVLHLAISVLIALVAYWLLMYIVPWIIALILSFVVLSVTYAIVRAQTHR